VSDLDTPAMRIAGVFVEVVFFWCTSVGCFTL